MNDAPIPRRPSRCAAARARRARRLGACALALAVVGAAGIACAADPAPAAIETPHRDPWVPPSAVPATPAAPTTGAQLRAEAEQRLATAFAAADTAHKGTLTRDEARAAGLGFVASHFDEIDTARAGAVSFDDVSRYLARRQDKAAAAPR
jgi:hypothetical protein